MTTAPPAITADDLEWVERLPGRTSAQASNASRCVELIGSFRKALGQRPGKWAVIESFESATAASATKNQIGKFYADRSELVGIELAGRKKLDGGSTLYARLVR